MTMQISSKQEIGGVRALKVRDWMARENTRTIRSLCACFRRSRETRYKPEEYITKRASVLLDALLELGYIVKGENRDRDDEQSYKLTKLGEEFSRASGAKRLKRGTARLALEDFRARLAEVNADPRFLVRVKRAVAYGSYLRSEETVGDLDLAVEYESKITATGEERRKILLKHFKACGRTSRSMFDGEWWWPEEEVKLFLKNRKRTISLHSFYDFLTMPKLDNFSYEVLLGDPEQIKVDLVHGEKLEKGDEPTASAVKRTWA